MFYWNINKLKLQLINEGLSQRALFVYIFIFVMLSELVTLLLPFGKQHEPDTLNILAAVADFVICMLGLFGCYRANGGKAGQQFAERFFSIGIVLMARFVVLLIPAYVVVFALAVVGQATAVEGIAAMMTIAVQVVSLLWFAAYFWRSAVHIGDVAKARSDVSQIGDVTVSA
ncbi:hypothetical protein WH50_14870 [Pokkaliibacter plantistimulans]|uniref:Chlorhexidine efflux transporter domain-containing protein n=1 Tax=Pokkaliibacter plantistimulans TaxID=1635171 RepID=A0ABX5LWC3_9GAMM|nr:hypothetical protein [Pokkaliibacter plantistimulans]PXF30512.1 hypothetical protein WH50_14870 [Pokkaliibacter plantistimulans]